MDITEENIRLLEMLLDRKQTELHIIYNLGAILGESMRTPELLLRLWPFLKDPLSLSALSIYELAPDGGCLTPVFSSGTAGTRPPIPRMEGAPWVAVTTGRPFMLEDASRYDGFLHYPGEVRGRRPSVIAAPLKAHDKVTGILLVERDAVPFENDDVDLVVMVGLLVAIGLEKCALFEKTENLSFRDSLTGLYNHRIFIEKLHDEADRMKRTKRPLSLIMMDIDDFKHINDSYGHKEGDTFLTEISALMALQIRTAPTDILARYGGEEFALVLAETSLDGAVLVAERIRKAVCGHPFKLVTANPHERPTISIGVATSLKTEECKAYLVKNADMALYHSKRHGKNRTSYAAGGEFVLAGPEGKP